MILMCGFFFGAGFFLCLAVGKMPYQKMLSECEKPLLRNQHCAIRVEPVRNET